MPYELLSQLDKFRITLLKKISETGNNKNLITEQSQLHFSDFTDSEKEILELLAHGLSCAEIAQKRFVSIKTVKIHIHNIYEKSGIPELQFKHTSTKKVKLVLYYLKHIGKLDSDWIIKD